MEDLKDLGFIPEQSNDDLSDLGFSAETDDINKDPSYLETIAHQVPQGLAFGLSDEIKGAISDPSGAYKTLSNLIGGNYPESETQQYKKVRDEERAALAATMEANPKTAILSQIAGGLLPGGAVAKGIGALAGAPLTGIQTALRAGAAEGALYGAGQSEGDTAKQIAKEAATGAALGGTLGAATGQLGKFLGGNSADVAKGIIPESQETIGAFQKLKESGLGKQLSEAFDRGAKNIDTSTAKKQAERVAESDVLSKELSDLLFESKKDLGTEIGERYKSLQNIMPDSLEAVKTRLSEIIKKAETPENVTQAQRVLSDINSTFGENGIQGIDLVPTRDYFQKLATRDMPREIQNLTSKLGSDLQDIARNTAGDLSPEFSELSSMLKQIKLKNKGFNDTEREAVAFKLKQLIEKSQTSDTATSELNNKMLNKIIETVDDPKIKGIISKIKENAKYGEVYKDFSSPNSKSIGGYVSRMALDVPAEIGGQISQNKLVKGGQQLTKLTNDYVLNAPPQVLKNIANKLDSVGAKTTAKYITNLAEATDEGKKRAIMNTINQMPSVRKALSSILPENNEE